MPLHGFSGERRAGRSEFSPWFSHPQLLSNCSVFLQTSDTAQSMLLLIRHLAHAISTIPSLFETVLKAILAILTSNSPPQSTDACAAETFAVLCKQGSSVQSLHPLFCTHRRRFSSRPTAGSRYQLSPAKRCAQLSGGLLQRRGAALRYAKLVVCRPAAESALLPRVGCAESAAVERSVVCFTSHDGACE